MSRRQRAEQGFEKIPKPAHITRTVRQQTRQERASARRSREYKAFIQGPIWRQQKARVHERDGYRCTEHDRDGVRCAYTKADGPLHAHHDRYHPRGIQYTPDKHIRTVCPAHHDRIEVQKWRDRPTSY